jgi:hypothetical protein
MKRFAVLVIVLLTLFHGENPSAKAQESCDLVYDFAEGQQGWTTLEWGVITGDGGYGGGTWTGHSFETEHIPDYSTMLIYLDFDPHISIDSVDFDVTYNYSVTPVGTIAHTRMQSDYNWVDTVGLDTYSAFANTGSETFTGAAHDVETARLWIDFRILDFSYRSAEITKVTIHLADCTPPGGDLTKPLLSEDTHPQWGMFDFNYVHGLDENWDSNQPDRVYAFSDKAEVNVHAVAPGLVTRVTPFIPEMCPELFHTLSAIFQACTVLIPQVITQEIQDYVFIWEVVNLSIIVVEDPDDSTIQYVYFVKDATVQPGDEVVAGCIIGRTIQLKNPSPVILASINASLSGGGSVGITGDANASLSGTGGATLNLRDLLTDTSMTIVYIVQDEETQETLSRLTFEPDDTNCKQESLAGCINAESDLQTLNHWVHNDGIEQLEGGGVSIPVRQNIYQSGIVVDTETTYTFTVQARSSGAGGDGSTLRLVVDLQHQDFELDDNWRVYSFTPPDPVLNPEAIAIANMGPLEHIEVRFACFAPNTISVDPNSCYFSNQEFDADGFDWEATNTTFASGQAYMLDDGTIAQTVRLLPNEDTSAHTYTISAQVRLLTTGDYTGQVDKSVTLEYQYPDTGDFVTLGTIDSALVLSSGLNPATGEVLRDFPYQFSDDFEISEDTNAPFTFRVNVSDPDNYIRGLRIDWLCINGPFPGQGGGGYEPPVIAHCAVVPLPTEDGIGPWIYYHWKNLERFFDCDLMILLNKWYKTFYDFQLTARYVMRWWIAFPRYVGNWSQTLFWWLDGHFHNMAIGQVTTITNEGGGCHDIFCAVLGVIDTLANSLIPIIGALANAINALVGILIGGVNFFFSVIGGVIAFILAIIVKLLLFLQSIGSLLATIVTAYNTATPASIPGLPTCSTNPDSSLLCIAAWVMDHTIFNGRWGVLFTIILSVLAIHLILWAIGEFKRMILNMGSTA